MIQSKWRGLKTRFGRISVSTIFLVSLDVKKQMYSGLDLFKEKIIGAGVPPTEIIIALIFFPAIRHPPKNNHFNLISGIKMIELK